MKFSRRAIRRVRTPLANAKREALDTVFRYAKKIPFVRDRIDAEFEKVLADLRHAARPYGDEFGRVERLPEQGLDRAEVLEQMKAMKSREDDRWRDGFVSGAVYHGDRSHIDFLNEVYALNSQTNPLHSDLWPRVTKWEAEIVSMTAKMLGADRAAEAGAEVCGVVSSGGTESIMLAMKTYRDHARLERGIRHPEMVVPVTAHAAFDKAAECFGIKKIEIPIDDDFRADVREAKRAIGRNTIAVVGSAPCFPHGVIDPIEELSELARARGAGFHTDACLGGFVLPFAEKLGAPVPPFDFRLPGVTSMSADTHKYGYAAKGTSVVLYRNKDLRRYQFFRYTEWPGGLYFSPTFAGSRPGALSAACWASMVTTGESGYLEATKAILDAAKTVREGIESIDGLRVLGDPLWVIAFTSDELDVYRVLDFMTKRNWNLNGLHKPACVHLAVTLRHTQPGVAERFVSDLRDAVAHVRSEPAAEGGMAPVYGLAASLPVRGAVGDILTAYLDVLYDA
jgi:glutamate/tyrosine decarboxylase-like PLP-dependent enzyme